MNGIFIRTLITMLGLFLASRLIPGVGLEGAGNFIIAALLLGLANAFVRPVMFLLTLPLTIVTLGLFIFILNAAMFGLVAALLDNFYVSGFWSALFGAIIVSITSIVASWCIGPDGRYEVIVVRRR
ncbi:MAG: phage holin family protein [Proteobacteria bacterium]|nr:phage holin family protein [Pseudomonadota bacterium]MCH9005355.1 phage holin family protein [Pseudomonadota bacterium]